MRPWLALRAAGIEFREEKITLDLPTTVEHIRKYSPSGRLPLLVDGDTSVWDSLAICEYAVELTSYPLWPESRAGRAHARSIVSEMHSGFATLRQQLSMDLRLETKIGHLLPETVSDIQRILEIWDDCMNEFKGPFLFGAQFTIADAFYAPVVLRFKSYGISIRRKTALSYMESVIQFAPVHEWVAEAKKEHNATFSF